MDDYCYAKMATSAKREHERESAPPTENNLKSEDEDIQQLIGNPEEVSPQLGGSSTLKQETPQPPCIKKEEEELCITQEGECLLGREEADYTKFPLSILSVKTEDDEEKPQVVNLLAPLSDSEAKDEVEEPMSRKTDCKELPLQPKEGSSTLKQEASQPPHIKKEEEELCITQEGECLLGREEADYTKFPLSILSVKTENDEEKPQVDNFLAPLSDSEAEDEVGKPLSSDTDCEGDMRTHTDNKHSECSTKKRGKKCLSCSICGQSFTKKSRLTRHMRTHTGEKPFKCSVCGKGFSQNSILTQHMRTHTGEKPFKCSVCGVSFSRNSHVAQHMRTHTGEKPFSCSVCGKSFSQTSNVTEHMRTHTGKKTFNCSICGKNYSILSSLSRHMKTHRDEKTLNCSACGKSFSVKSHLTQHMRTHTGEKQFNCSVCGKSFPHSSSLCRHMRTHAGEKTFSCSVCCKRFTHNADAVKHIRTHKGK
ncbi:zinc finger protein 771-like isoform X2 [Entelurus aequoreus]|uniref:zinc finger protein 771-like isoform X2 n=1 Tax=Entelurus aequoreus TaxID=161455 RepID=UPI002B1D51E0|nr:zinc finger protein 771-like isoform X2 [Entelurus aequoreus]